MTENNNNPDQGKEAAKVLNAFNNNVQKLTAIVAGPDNLKVVKKVSKNNVESLVAELFKEETEATIVEVKTDLKSLLKNYVTLNNSIREEKAKLDNLEISKKKEFNTAASRLFNRMEGVDLISREYYEAFNVAAAAVEVVDDTEAVDNTEVVDDNEVTDSYSNE